jgi:hypothetical protein
MRSLAFLVARFIARDKIFFARGVSRVLYVRVHKMQRATVVHSVYGVRADAPQFIPAWERG